MHVDPTQKTLANEIRIAFSTNHQSLLMDVPDQCFLEIMPESHAHRRIMAITNLNKEVFVVVVVLVLFV